MATHLLLAQSHLQAVVVEVELGKLVALVAGVGFIILLVVQAILHQ